VLARIHGESPVAREVEGGSTCTCTPTPKLVENKEDEMFQGKSKLTWNGSGVHYIYCIRESVDLEPYWTLLCNWAFAKWARPF